jgi:hypothetical protein
VGNLSAALEVSASDQERHRLSVWCNTSSPIAPRLIAHGSRIIPPLIPATSHWHNGHESLRPLSGLIDRPSPTPSTQRPIRAITSSALSPSAHRDTIPDFAYPRTCLPVPCCREVSSVPCLPSSSSASQPPPCFCLAAHSAPSRLHISASSPKSNQI